MTRSNSGYLQDFFTTTKRKPRRAKYRLTCFGESLIALSDRLYATRQIRSNLSTPWSPVPAEFGLLSPEHSRKFLLIVLFKSLGKMLTSLTDHLWIVEMGGWVVSRELKFYQIHSASTLLSQNIQLIF